MTTVLAITDEIKTLGQVEAKLGISLTENSQFFSEWSVAMPEPSSSDRSRLDQVRRNYLYQSSDGVLLEETVKMVILSPLLELAGFYQAPYKFRAEVSVEISAIGDHDELLRGRIDGLVVQDQLWIVLIEAKKTTFDLEMALPQTLAYMAAAPEHTRPLYGLITNGSSYLFVKLLGQEYGISDIFATRSPHRNNLHEVLQILKHLGTVVA
jgi:predicted type IV restriction endonuclease